MTIRKIMATCLLSCMLLSSLAQGDVYSISFKSVDGNKINLHQYKGRKILFVTLPLVQQDSGAIEQLMSFQKVNAGNLAVIGILANDLGLSEEKQNDIKKMYKKGGDTGIIITEGMNTKKDSAQSALLQWLTSKEKNRRFNTEVRGVGFKFFVNEEGKLYAVIGPEVAYSNQVFARILNVKVIVKQPEH